MCSEKKQIKCPNIEPIKTNVCNPFVEGYDYEKMDWTEYRDDIHPHNKCMVSGGFKTTNLSNDTKVNR